MKSGKRLFISAVALLTGILVISQVSYASKASRFADDLRQKRTSEAVEAGEKVNKVFSLAEEKEAEHLEPMIKFINIARERSSDLERQRKIVKTLINIGPVYKVVDGRVIKNPAAAMFLEKVGIKTSEEEALAHEAAELTLNKLDGREFWAILSTLENVEGVSLPDEIVEWFKDVYDRNYAQGEGSKTFNEDPKFALKHIIAEVHDGGSFPIGMKKWGLNRYSYQQIARSLHRHVEKILKERGISWKEFTGDDVMELDEDSIEVKNSKERILTAAIQLASANQEKIRKLAQADAAAALQEGIPVDVIERVDGIGTEIAKSDDKFYSSLGADDISAAGTSVETGNSWQLISAKDVLENLAGFKEECSNLGNLPIHIVSHNDKESLRISRLKEAGFLPQNVALMSTVFFGFTEFRERSIIILGFEGSFRDAGGSDMVDDIIAADPKSVQVIRFADIKEGELLNWKRAFAALIIAISGEVPGIEKTNLETALMETIARGEGIYGLQVGVKVSNELMEDARRAYEAVKTNI